MASATMRIRMLSASLSFVPNSDTTRSLAPGGLQVDDEAADGDDERRRAGHEARQDLADGDRDGHRDRPGHEERPAPGRRRLGRRLAAGTAGAGI